MKRQAPAHSKADTAALKKLHTDSEDLLDLLDRCAPGEEVVTFLQKESKPFASLARLLEEGHPSVPKALALGKAFLGPELFQSQFLEGLQGAQSGTYNSLTHEILHHPTPAYFQMFLDHPELNFTQSPYSNLLYCAHKAEGQYFYLGLTALKAALQTYPRELITKLNTWIDSEDEDEDEGGKPTSDPVTYLAHMIKASCTEGDLDFKELLITTICHLAPHLLAESHTQADDLFTMALENGYFGLLPLFGGDPALAPRNPAGCFEVCQLIDTDKVLALIFALPVSGEVLYTQMLATVAAGKKLSPELTNLRDVIQEADSYPTWREGFWQAEILDKLESMRRTLASPDLSWEDEASADISAVTEELGGFLSPFGVYTSLEVLSSSSIVQLCILRSHSEKCQVVSAPGWSGEWHLASVVTSQALLEAAQSMEPNETNVMVWLEDAPAGRFFLPPKALTRIPLGEL